jgi:hypothetical protein
MEPLTYFFEPINRNAIVVRPKKPFFAWLKAIFPDDEEMQDKPENNIYLIHEMDSNEEIREMLSFNFDDIFTNELNDWCTDEEFWPQNRTYKMFSDWFDAEICSMVLDMEDDEVLKE